MLFGSNLTLFSTKFPEKEFGTLELLLFAGLGLGAALTWRVWLTIITHMASWRKRYQVCGSQASISWPAGAGDTAFLKPYSQPW
jgi:hypothetical protein